MRKTFVAVVGEDKTEFTLYTNVASRSSKFFQAALGKVWQESLQNRVTLKDVKAIEFETYLQWLSTNDHSFLADSDLHELAGLYILGDFLDDLAFRVEMLNWFTSRAINENICPHPLTLTLIWEQTPDTSPLRKMSIEAWITRYIECLAREFAKTDRDIPREFIVGCLRRIGETQARVRECIVGEARRKFLEARRDEVLNELDA